MPRSEKDRLAAEVQERWIDFNMALSDKRRYPIAEFKASWEAGKRYGEMTKRDALMHRVVVEAVNGLTDFLSVERKRVPEVVIRDAERLESRLTQRVFQGGVASVWVLCVDRFARNTEDPLRISRQFLEHGAKLKFVEAPADLETPEGKFQFTQYAAFAAFEHARLRAPARCLAAIKRWMAAKADRTVGISVMASWSKTMSRASSTKKPRS